MILADLVIPISALPLLKDPHIVFEKHTLREHPRDNAYQHFLTKIDKKANNSKSLLVYIFDISWLVGLILFVNTVCLIHWITRLVGFGTSLGGSPHQTGRFGHYARG